MTGAVFLILHQSSYHAVSPFFPLSPPLLPPSPHHAHTQHSSMSHSDVVRSCHKLPDSSSLDAERKLQRIATQGGTLFNRLECNVLCIDPFQSFYIEILAH